MALPMLVGGADCGPHNPLQGLSKELDRDRGLQQDHFGAGRAGSSNQGFRSQYSAAPGAEQEAARFFSAGSSAGPSNFAPTPYDLASLHHALPPAQTRATLQSPGLANSAAGAAWAADFMQDTKRAQSPFVQTFLTQDQRSSQLPASPVYSPAQSSLMTSPLHGASWASAPVPLAQHIGPMAFQPVSPMTTQPGRAHAANEAQWDEAFQSHEALSATSISETVQEVKPALSVEDPDALARVAGSLIDAVRDEQNPKFRNSAFLGFMKQLRDREVVLEGNKLVPRDATTTAPTISSGASSWTADFQTSVDVKGKGRAFDFGGASVGAGQTPAISANFGQARNAEDDLRSQTTLGLPAAEEDIDAYFRAENDSYVDYWHGPTSEQQRGRGTPQQQREWDRLQRDWDRFEATATGIRPTANYQFQVNNPYLLGEASTRHHMMHSQEHNTLYDSVLEMEAAVQRDPHNAQTWFALGVKQQENERELKAIQALRRALELDESHLPSWLALAVSHTNEGNRHGSYEAIREWVEHNDRYRPAVNAFMLAQPENDDMSQTDKFNRLIDCLISMARSDTSGEIDADIQIALAVLMNTNEAYEKAKDCFTTALAVRPDDWQLYNRVGATLANSGQPAEALEYYYRALELNPTYIRARFNLGISCINLRRYNEAAQHILDALALQESDSVRNPDGSEDIRGITSTALWDSLKTCSLHLGRLDLATICDQRDIDAFRLNFTVR